MKRKIDTAKDFVDGYTAAHGKAQHGGKRKGAGRKKTGVEPTKVMRVPMSLVSHVVGLIKKV